MDNSGVNISNFVVPPVEGVAGGGTGYGWTEGCNQRSNFGRGIIDPTQIPSADLLHVWCMPSTTNVGDQEMPRPFNHVSLLAARNERESVQIALRPKFSWVSSGIAGTVQIQCTDLFSASGDSLVVGKSLTMRRVVPILGVPDALVPLSLPITQINLLPGETTSIWVSVDVPAGQPPGQYEGHMLITALKADAESAQVLAKANKYNVYREVNNCLEIVESIDGKPPEEVAARMKSTASSLKRLLLLPVFQELSEENGSCDMMDEDPFSNISINLKISVTVWEFTLPLTPSLPAVFGISETVIEDRFGLEHGSEGWYDSLDRHFKWLLQYRISPYFCRWGDSMRILAYTCPWPADHPRSEEYYSDPRLAAYAVPYTPIFACNSNDARESLHKDVEVLKSKHHWRKAYFYLWDEPQNSEQYELIRSMSADIRSYAPDARVLTTYYCGPNDAHYGPNSFEGFVKVPNYLRPHTQIFCTSEWVFGNREDLVSDVIAELQPENGEEWWTYVCMGPTDPQPNWHLGMRGTQHRAVMWRVWKEGGTGFLYWGANCYDKSLAACAEIKFRHGLPPGDGVLFYPGEVFSSSHEPVASIRLERILSGMQDFEYLKLYSSRYGREEGLALLERTGVYHSPERYTLEHSPVDLMRAEIYRTCRS